MTLVRTGGAGGRPIRRVIKGPTCSSVSGPPKAISRIAARPILTCLMDLSADLVNRLHQDLHVFHRRVLVDPMPQVEDVPGMVAHAFKDVVRRRPNDVGPPA